MIRFDLTFNEAFIKKLAEEEEERLLKEKLNEIYDDLVEATPIDTGEARRSWYISLSNLTIENSSEYIGRLNHGHSSQAPKFFIERVVLNHGKPNGIIVNYQ